MQIRKSTGFLLLLLSLSTLRVLTATPVQGAVQLDLTTYGPAPFLPDDGQKMHLPAVVTWQEGDPQYLNITVQLRNESTSEVRKTFNQIVDTKKFPGRRYQCDFLWDGLDDQSNAVAYGSYSVYFEAAALTAGGLQNGEAAQAQSSGAAAVCGGAQVTPRTGMGDIRTNRGDPVNAVSGNLYLEETDIEYKGNGPFLGIRRHYNSYRVPLGVGWYNYDGWTFSFNEALRLDGSDGSVTYLPPDGTEWRFEKNTDGAYTPVRPNCRLTLSYQSEEYCVTAPDGFTTRFNKYGGMKSQTDTNGNGVVYTWENIETTLPPPLISSELYWFTEPRPTGRFRITRITDSRGRWIQISYDSEGRIAGAEDSIGRKVTYTYGPISYKTLSEVKPSEGPTRSFVYGEKTHLDLIKIDGHPYSTIEYYPWPSGYRVKRQVFADGSTTEYAFLPDEHKTTITTNSRVSTVEYDEKGDVTADVDPMGNRFQYTYDSSRRLTSLKDPLGGTISYTYDSKGNISTVTGLDGKTIAYEYNAGFAKLTRTLFPDGTENRFTYDSKGNLVAQVDALGNTTTHTYDSTGLPVRTTYPEGDSLVRTYDANGFIATIRDAASSTTLMTHNAAGWLLSLAQPDGSTLQFAYDSHGNLKSATDGFGRVTTCTYDARLNLVRTQTPDARVTGFIYDPMDRRVGVIDPTGRSIGTPYDLDGSLARVTDQGSIEFPMGYDLAKRLTSRESPVGDLALTYDTSGNVLSVANPESGGRSLGYVYDAAEREVYRIVGDEWIKLTYDPLTSRLISAKDAGGTTSFAYDAAGRLVSKQTPLIGKLLMKYDREGQVQKITPPGKKPIVYKYNAIRELIAVEHNGTRLARYYYDVNHRLQKVVLANGIKGEFTYDANGNISKVAYSSASVPNLHTVTYKRDKQDAITKETMRGSLFGRTQNTYKYDAAHRLTSATVNGIVTQYAYDQHENRIHTKKGTAEPVVYSYDMTYRLLSAGKTMYTYDADNNVASRTTGGATTNFAYDAKGRIKRATFPGASTESYTYNGVDERVKTAHSEKGTVRVLWAQGDILATCLPKGGIDTLYVRGHGLVAAVTASGVYYYLQDGLSNVIAVTDASGAVTQTYRYDPFGRFTESKRKGAIANSFTYRGQWYDASTKLYYLRNRYYDPAIGRFISTDPVGPLPEPNPYQYSFNNPVNLEDPMGLSPDLKKFFKRLLIPNTKAGWGTETDYRKLLKGLLATGKFLWLQGGKYQLFGWFATVHKGGLTACGGATQARGQALANELPQGWKITGYNWYTTNNTPHTFNIATYTSENGNSMHFYVDSYLFPTLLPLGGSITPYQFAPAADHDGDTFNGHD